MEKKFKVTVSNRWKKIALVAILIFSLLTILKLLKETYKEESLKLSQSVDSGLPLQIPQGFKIQVFADLAEIGSPRVLTFDLAGNLLVSIPRVGKVIALLDEDKNGISEKFVDIETNLNAPHGITFDEQGFLYIAETDKVTKFGYGITTKPDIAPQVLFKLPTGGGHTTRSVKVYKNMLYTTIGSSCNVCVEKNVHRSTMLMSDLEGKNLEVFASGLRNTVFFDFDDNGQIWGNDMGRDNLGDNLPPDELNIIEKGRDYGWPFCYGKKVNDSNFMHEKGDDYCQNTAGTIFDYPAHVAPLGITFIDSKHFRREESGDLLVAFHGSWNSSVSVGYKIVKLNIEDGKVTGMEDFVTGFINGDIITGRPVDLIFAQNGELFISDDEANLIYRLYK